MTRPAFKRLLGLIALAALAASIFATRVAAQTAAEALSVYTSTTEQDCRLDHARRRAPEDGGTRVCPGPHGFVVVVAENDLRETVSVGRIRALANKEPAARAWFKPFSSAATTVEWRSRRSGSRPFAIIQRWSLADNNDVDKDGHPRDKHMLVVTRLPPGSVCHVAYVDVQANANANDLARKAADAARSFDCARDKVAIVGNPGRATELAQ